MLFVTDLDGTLLKDDGSLPDDFYETYLRIKENGGIFVAASGRQLAGIQNVFPEIKDEMAYLAENGALGYYQGEVIHLCTLNQEDIKVIEKATADNRIRTFSGRFITYVERHNQIHEETLKKYMPSVKYIDDLSEIDEPILKISVFKYDGVDFELLERLKSLNIEANAMTAAHQWIDVIPSHSNKGVGLSKLTSYFNIDQNNVFVFGDQHNDLEMLALVENSFAMNNATNEAKEVAKFELEHTNQQQGVTIKMNQILDQFVKL